MSGIPVALVRKLRDAQVLVVRRFEEEGERELALHAEGCVYAYNVLLALVSKDGTAA